VEVGVTLITGTHGRLGATGPNATPPSVSKVKGPEPRGVWTETMGLQCHLTTAQETFELHSNKKYAMENAMPAFSKISLDKFFSKQFKQIINK